MKPGTGLLLAAAMVVLSAGVGLQGVWAQKG